MYVCTYVLYRYVHVGVTFFSFFFFNLQVYELSKMAALAKLPDAFIIGAGAGSSLVAGVNCEVRCV